MCGALYTASLNAEEFAYEFGETVDTVIETNKATDNESIKKQMILDFEEELKKMDPFFRSTPPQKTNTISNSNNTPAYPAGDMLIW